MLLWLGKRVGNESKKKVRKWLFIFYFRRIFVGMCLSFFLFPWHGFINLTSISFPQCPFARTRTLVYIAEKCCRCTRKEHESVRLYRRISSGNFERAGHADVCHFKREAAANQAVVTTTRRIRSTAAAEEAQGVLAAIPRVQTMMKRRA